MRKFLRISVSLLLVVILFSMAMPIYALDEISVKEIEELREENVKHFDMGDGTYKAVTYSEPVHRKDADGKWQDIDNTLEAEKENGNTSYKTADGRIKFSKNVKNANGKIFELSENGYKIDFSLIDNDVKGSSASIKNHKGKKTPTVLDSKEEQYAKLQSVDNLTKIKYNDIKEDIDIEYLIYSNNIKENIIVNSRKDSYVYTFELKLNKLTALLNSDGSISLNDEKTAEEKYVMPAPFMVDDNGALSENVHYTLTPSGKYKYVITVTADTEWINSKEREFPVTIDPTVEVTNSYDEAYISSTSPNSNYSSPSDGRLYVSPTQRTFVKFALPNIGSNVEITGAELVATYFFTQYGSATVGVYEVPYSWNKNTITWNNSVASHQSAESNAATFTEEYLSGSTESYPITMHLDITEAVSGWYSGRANNGIALKCMESSDDTFIICGYNYYNSNSYVTYDNLWFEISYRTAANIYDGTYFFRNNGVNTYMQSEMRNAGNYDNTRLNAFDGDKNQRWNITYLPNGYYSIKSVDTGKALTAPSSNGGEITLKTYDGSYNQMWSITKDSNELYRISPKNNSTSHVTFGTIINSNEPNERYLVLNQSSSTANGNEWIFCEYAPDHSFVTQEMSNWCWIACVLNFADCFIDIDCTQVEIAEAFQGQHTTINYTGNSMDITNAFNYIFGSTNLYKMVFGATGEDYDPDNHNNESISNDRVNISDYKIEEILSGDNPCPIILGKNGHVVLVYDCYRDQSGELELLIYDPTQIGINCYSASYNEFFNTGGIVDYFLTLNYGNS